MQAIRVHQHGGPEELRFEEIPDPSPAAGHVRVRLEAIGVNFVDIYQRTGLYQVPLPFTPGSEGAGTIDAVGAGVTDLVVGDRVAYRGPLGAYAQRHVIPAERAVRLPADVPTRLGAAVMLQGMTAEYLTTSVFPLRPGHTALIHAAAGGTGLLLVQAAKTLGARVIATTSTAEKAALAREAGADEVLTYDKVPAGVRQLTNNQGVDVVYDSVGRDTFEGSLDSLRPRGMMVLFGGSSGPVPPIDSLVLMRKGSLFFTRPSLDHYAADPAEMRQRASQVFKWIEDGKLKIRIGHEYPLRDAADAQRALESRQTTGKILLIP
jgi:NADPH2:quinone reductase